MGSSGMKNNKTCLIALVIAAIATVFICVIVTVVPVKRTDRATKYDLNCITKMGGRPLQDCRIESDKCLFEIDGTNTYELRPWEDCEE